MLVRCRILLREFPEGVTAKNLNVLMNSSRKFAHSINNVQNVDAHLVTRRHALVLSGPAGGLSQCMAGNCHGSLERRPAEAGRLVHQSMISTIR